MSVSWRLARDGDLLVRQNGATSRRGTLRLEASPVRVTRCDFVS